MSNVYKIGLTTNSIYQRMLELNTTGVPKPYRAEKIFEVEEHFLSRVERSAHMHLKSKGMHHGKEFFESKLQDCIQAVEDAIFEVTNCRSWDIIGEAVRRAEEKKVALEAEQRRFDRLNGANNEIDKQREVYKTELKRRRPDSFYSDLVSQVCFPVICVAVVLGPAGWIVAAILAYWVYTRVMKKRRDSENKEELEAEAKYPYFTLDNFRA